MNWTRYKNIVMEEVEARIINNKKKADMSENVTSLLFPNRKFSDQSIAIKMGYVIENSFKRFVQEFKDVKDLNVSKLNHYQIDLIFEYKDTIFCFEVKSNLNLDTKKIFREVQVKKEIQKLLETKYSGKKICNKFLGFCVKNSDGSTKHKKDLESNMIYGWDDFFKIFDINISEKEWHEFFKSIGDYLIKFKEETT